MTVESLKNGERIAVDAFEITSIPHMSIIDENKRMNEIVD